MPARFSAIVPGARLSSQVAEALTAEIRAGRLKAGTKLPSEAALVTQFGVSRTVVREAVSRLKSLGLLDSRQGSGVFVCDAGVVPLSFGPDHLRTRSAVIQMVELRRALEAEVAALAAQRAKAADLRAIRKAVTALEKAVAQGGDGVEEDVLLHRAIAEAARNPFLSSTLDYLAQFLRGATRVTRANEARRADFAEQVREEHAAIVQAIAQADSALARETAAQHMDNAIRRIESADSSFWAQEGALLAQPLVKGLAAGKP